jgi:hypothetical protein
MVVGVSRLGRATFPGLRESYRLGTPNAGNLRLIEEGNGAGQIYQSSST